ncbi:MAG: DNA repair protein RadC, partial [Deltaproteobacteria bacterium]|nr:DNA repair protein RadC [Deltaproteobacteria bacterium]
YKIKKVKDKILGRQISDAKTVVQLFEDLQNETKEKLITINLDSKNKIICFEVVAIGSLNAIYLRPGEVFRTSILVNAAAAIVIHNHPSGDPRPSKEDKELTKHLKIVSDAMGLSFYDHVIIGLDGYFSFAEKLLIK